MKEKIKDIIKKNKEIWIGTLICIIILTIYILLSKLSENRIFLILVNLSFSYIAAVIFYIAQVEIPDKKKTEKALLTFQGDLLNVYDELEMIIIYIDEFWSLKGNKLTIKELDNNIHYYLYEKNRTKFKEYIYYNVYKLRGLNNDEKNEYKKELELCKKGIINLKESEKILYREE